MKNIKKLLISLSVAVASIGASLLLTQNKPVEVEASRATKVTGMYERVRDISRIEDGDEVIICINTYEMLSYFGGNPASAVFTTGGLYFASDKIIVGLENSEATVFTVGYNESTHLYTFRGSMEMTSNSPYDVLLAHVPYNTSTDFNAIGYFTGDRFGAYKYSSSKLNDTKCQWKLSYSTDEDNNILLTNNYTSDCARSYSIYRKANSKDFYGNYNNLSFRNYFIGDDLKLDGYSVHVADGIVSADEWDYDYEEIKDLLYFVGDGKAKSGVTSYELKLRGLPNYFQTFEIEINEPTSNPGYKYTYVTPGMLKDYRGTYLAIEQEEGNHFFNAKNPIYEVEESNSTATTITDGVISITNHAMIDQGLIIDKKFLNNRWVYVAKTSEIFPRYYSNKYYTEYPSYPYNERFITLTDELTEANVLTIKENPNGGMTFGFVPSYDDTEFYGFSYDTYDKNFYFETSDYTQNARLYKIDKTEDYDDQLARFIEKFEDETQYCDETGESRRIFDNGWSKIEHEFNMLGEDVKGYLASLTYTHNAETPGTAKYVVDKYDFIISKYDDLNDFMDRRGANTLQNTYTTPNTFAFDTSLVLPIVVIALLSFATIGGAILVYKRKH